MTKWFYQIKLKTGYASFEREVLAQNIIEAESKQDVLKYIEKNYPEYFDGLKVAQKLTKKSEQIVYCTIYELTPYWEKYWSGEIECCVCGRKLPILTLRNYLGDIEFSKFTCCADCRAKRDEVLQRKTEENNDAYWESRCEYYYIYKITNKHTNQCYIGYTARKPLFRWWEHYKHSDLPIGKALENEGIKNFTFEILEMIPKSESSVSDMHKLETSYISRYDSIANGYNCIMSDSESKSIKPRHLFEL